MLTCDSSVTGIGIAKIFLTYKDRLYRSYSDDWTYSINFCVNHAENNTAIIVACIPALRGLIMRWISPHVRSSAADEENQKSPNQLRRWPSDRAKREWDISISAMTGSTTVTMDTVTGTRKIIDNNTIRSIGSDTTLGKETYMSLAGVERSYNPTMKEIDEMEFITVKSGILERYSADGNSSARSSPTL
jgi:hypothetical protein